MKVGSFNFNEYLDKLNEELESKEGMIIPDTNKKSYDWLKAEYQKAQTEVTVTMTSAKFTPGYSFQGSKDFKPEMNMGGKTSSSFKQESLGKQEKKSKGNGNPFARENKSKKDNVKSVTKQVKGKETKEDEDKDNSKENKKSEFLKKKLKTNESLNEVNSLNPASSTVRHTGTTLGGVALATTLPSLSSILVPLGIGAAGFATAGGLGWLAYKGFKALKNKKSKKKIDNFVKSVIDLYATTHMQMIKYEFTTTDDENKKNQNINRFNTQLSNIKKLLIPKQDGKKYVITDPKTKQIIKISNNEKNILDTYKAGFDLSVFDIETNNLNNLEKVIKDENKKKEIEAKKEAKKQAKEKAKQQKEAEAKIKKEESFKSAIEYLKRNNLELGKIYKIDPEKLDKTTLEQNVLDALDKIKTIQTINKDGIVILKFCYRDNKCENKDTNSLIFKNIPKIKSALSVVENKEQKVKQA